MTAVAARPRTVDAGFATVFGRELIQELPNFVHRPYLVVTMADLWPRFEHLFDRNLAAVHLVDTLDVADLGLASAMGVVLLAVAFVVTYFSLRYSRGALAE